jgi:hypothetical protein
MGRYQKDGVPLGPGLDFRILGHRNLVMRREPRRAAMSLMGQIRTHASPANCFDHLVSSGAGDGAAHRAYRRAESVLIKREIPAIELP